MKNYPDLVNYLNQTGPVSVFDTKPVAKNRAFGDQSRLVHHANNIFPAFGSGGDRYKADLVSQYSYAPKSKVIYQRRNHSTASSVIKSLKDQLSNYEPQNDDYKDHESRLSKATVQRFNEALSPRASVGPKSSLRSAAKSMISKPNAANSVRSSYVSQSSKIKKFEDKLSQMQPSVAMAPVAKDEDKEKEDEVNQEQTQEDEQPEAVEQENEDQVEALPDSVS